MARFTRLVAVSLVAAAGFAAQASAEDADNSRVNRRDDGVAQPTADQQPSNRSDEELARRIRSAVTADKSLSMYAHNVKIIAQNGHVVLRGPVRTPQEKRIIEQKAAQAAGLDKVENRLDVAPK